MNKETPTPINPVWTFKEFLEDFDYIEYKETYTKKEVILEDGTKKQIPVFKDKFVVVIRKLDGQKGTMHFRSPPVEYFNFIPDD